MIVLLFFNNTNSRIKAISVTVTHNYPEVKYQMTSNYKTYISSLELSESQFALAISCLAICPR